MRPHVNFSHTSDTRFFLHPNHLTPKSSNTQLLQLPASNSSNTHPDLQDAITLEQARSTIYNMAPPTIADDYYSTLGVDQTATLELITRAYQRLALKLHPDRGGSTQAFQLLGLAYEILNDENKRRACDQIYSSTGRSRTNPQRAPGTQTPRPSPAPASQSDIRSDEDLLAALRKENEVRGAQWRLRREGLMQPIVRLQRTIRVLEQKIKDLSDAAVAEAAVKARKKNKSSTAHDPFSALSIDDDEDEKARNDRRRRHREIRTEIESKEWDLGLQEAELQEKQKVLDRAKQVFDAANLINDRKIQAIEARVRERKAHERQGREKEKQGREREKREQEKRQNFMRQAREAQEAARKRQAEKQRSKQAMREQRAAEAQKARDDAQRARDDAQRVRDDAQRARDYAQRVRDEAQRVRDEAQRARDAASARDDAQKAQDVVRRARIAAQRERDDARRARRKARKVLAAELARQEEQERLQSACGHGGWWDKVPGPTTCPECQGVWSFLLKCPDCHLQVCPRCQLVMRPRVRRNTAKTDRSSD
jgi:curved DNA-binding protein CbpA